MGSATLPRLTSRVRIPSPAPLHFRSVLREKGFGVLRSRLRRSLCNHESVRRFRLGMSVVGRVALRAPLVVLQLPLEREVEGSCQICVAGLFRDLCRMTPALTPRMTPRKVDSYLRRRDAPPLPAGQSPSGPPS